ncbi:MAG: hypothetical protein ACO1Q7_19155 [Gemmatimonas sp.]
MSTVAAEQFAKIIIATEPYHKEIVFVGGWVHALYLAEANDSGAIFTDDIDITIPRSLLMNDRASLLELAAKAGFELDPVSQMQGSPSMLEFESTTGTRIPLDILTEGEPRTPVAIEGQQDLFAAGYHGQQMLMDNTREMEVGSNLHSRLDPPQRIRVPMLGAYGLQKALSSESRTNPTKSTKDLVYLYEIARHPVLGNTLRPELSALNKIYPKEYGQFCATLIKALRSARVINDICEQLHYAGRTFGPIEETRARVSAHFQRLVQLV